MRFGSVFSGATSGLRGVGTGLRNASGRALGRGGRADTRPNVNAGTARSSRLEKLGAAAEIASLVMLVSGVGLFPEETIGPLADALFPFLPEEYRLVASAGSCLLSCCCVVVVLAVAMILMVS